jgi:hypothetical protein
VEWGGESTVLLEYHIIGSAGWYGYWAYDGVLREAVHNRNAVEVLWHLLGGLCRTYFGVADLIPFFPTVPQVCMFFQVLLQVFLYFMNDGLHQLWHSCFPTDPLNAM